MISHIDHIERIYHIMKKVAVVYWSSTGNTEQMAYAVAEGAKDAGAKVTMFTSADFAANQVSQFDAIAFGCPAMGAEVLEETEFEPLFTDCIKFLSDRPIALFGSYGWGDGEWMRSWERTCKDAGLNLVHNSVICCEAPDDDARVACRSMGASLS